MEWKLLQNMELRGMVRLYSKIRQTLLWIMELRKLEQRNMLKMELQQLENRDFDKSGHLLLRIMGLLIMDRKLMRKLELHCLFKCSSNIR